jgi:hypothetical protein
MKRAFSSTSVAVDRREGGIVTTPFARQPAMAQPAIAAAGMPT